MQEGHFILSSGLHSSVYLQSAIVLSYPEYLKLIALELVNLIKTKISEDEIDLVVSPAMGGIIIGSKVGELLGKRSIFLERVNSELCFRRGFNIKKKSRVLIIEDVITTGKSSLECAKLIKKSGAILLGFACLIDRSNKQTLKIKGKKIVSQVKLIIPTFKEKNVPLSLKKIPITKPGSRFLK